MSEIKNKDRILEAIDQLRRRKARPDIDRICNFLLRRFAVNGKDTIADLSRMVDAEIVIKVEYKGNTSYRNAAKWSRLAVYKNKESGVVVDNNLPEARNFLSRAFASLLVEDPDYLDFGIPAGELKRFLLEEEVCGDLSDIDTILHREIHSGYLVKLENGNYSLADHPVPSCAATTNATTTTATTTTTAVTTNNNNVISLNGDVNVLKYETSTPPPSHFNEEADGVVVDAEHLQKQDIISVSQNIDSVMCNEGPTTTTSTTTTTTTTGAINVGGFRVGVRRKRAKKVFDPSDNNIPTRKRGRPVGSTNKVKETPQTAPKIESEINVCAICRHQGSSHRRGQADKFISCRNCNVKAHPSCLDVTEKGLQTDSWRCGNCKSCVHCSHSGEPEAACAGCCGDDCNATCQASRGSEKARSSRWLVSRGSSSRSSKAGAGASNNPSSRSTMVVGPCGADCPTPRSSPVPDAVHAYYPTSTACVDTDDFIDERIPDVSDWSVDQVCRYLEEQGYPEMADIFRDNNIDGHSLLLLRRKDVLQGMQMKLGPALKAYRQVKLLQLRRCEPHLFWA